MTEARVRRASASIEEKVAVFEDVLCHQVSAGPSVPPPPKPLRSNSVELGAEDDMMQGTEGPGGCGLIEPRRLHNPCLESPQRMDLHRELLFNQRIGKNVLNQKSELQKALSKHKEKQSLNHEKEQKETPELERAIAERARRLEMAEVSNSTEVDPATNPTYQEVRAKLRHANSTHVQ